MDTKHAVSAPIAYKIAFAIWLTRWRVLFSVLSIAGILSAFSNYSGAFASGIVIGSALILVVLLSRLLSLIYQIPRRISHFQRTDFADVVYLDGIETCVFPQEITSYQSVLQIIERELGVPLQYHTLVVYDRGAPIPPLGHGSRLFRCVFAQLIPSSTQEAQIEGGVILQQALLFYLHITRKLWYVALSPVSRFETGLLTALMSSYWRGIRSVEVYYTAVRRRLYGGDTFFIDTGRDHIHNTHNLALLLAFAAHRFGLKKAMQCCLRARGKELVSQACLTEYFGGMDNLLNDWYSYLDLVLESIPDTSQYETAIRLNELRDQLLHSSKVNSKEVIETCRAAAEKHPRSANVLNLSLECAILTKDLSTALLLVRSLKPLVNSPCFNEQLLVAEALLDYIVGDRKQNTFGDTLSLVSNRYLRGIVSRYGNEHLSPADLERLLTWLFVFRAASY